jgi:hypothetical protein
MAGTPGPVDRVVKSCGRTPDPTWATIMGCHGSQGVDQELVARVSSHLTHCFDELSDHPHVPFRMSEVRNVSGAF